MLVPLFAPVSGCTPGSAWISEMGRHGTRRAGLGGQEFEIAVFGRASALLAASWGAPVCFEPPGTLR